ncbi:hypothetical protein FQN54_007721 [Arachnomyces sp. PD_36]|nr:hypothetical protein FQN54_007721 [Arachnomyces sp. PD_36]
MAPSLPTELLLSITQQWPCRDLQILQLASLLSPYTPSPATIVVHGIEATGKSGIVRSILSQYGDQDKDEDDDTYSSSNARAIPHAYVRCAECITGRHLLSKIIAAILAALGLPEDAVKGAIDHVCTMGVVLKDIFEGRKGGGVGEIEKLVLVLDGVEEQREAQQFLLPALARLGEMIPALCVVMILSTTPQPLAFEVVGIPHVYFPPYTRKEAISIITSSPPPPIPEGELPPETTSHIYPQFVSTVYDSLIGPTASTIPSFRSVCARLWPQFVGPITRGEKPLASGSGEQDVQWDFTRLLVKNRRIFQHHGEGVLVHRIAAPVVVPPPTTTSTTATATTKDTLVPTLPLSLPYLPTLVLTSAYLATYTHPRLDTVLFSKFASSASAQRKKNHHKRKLKKIFAQTDTSAPPLQGADDPQTPRKKNGPGRPRKGETKAKREVIGAGSGLTARPFPLERLLAIYRAIDPDPTLLPSSKGATAANATADAVADMVYTELATLHRLRLVVPASRSGGGGGSKGDTLPGGSEAVDAGEKWRVNVSGEWVVGMAKRIGIEVQEFVGDV